MHACMNVPKFSFEHSHTLIKSSQTVGTGHHSQSHKNQNDRNFHHVKLLETMKSWDCIPFKSNGCGLSPEITTIP